MITSLSKREKRLAVVTAIVVLSALAYRFIVAPQMTRLFFLRHQSDELELRLVEMERNLALGDYIEAQYRGYESLISQKGTDLQEATAFLRTVSSVTRANEMKLVEYRHLPIQPSLYYKVFALRIGVETRPIWLARFLRTLASQKELLRVEDIIIMAIDDNENLKVNMKLTKVVAAERDADQ